MYTYEQANIINSANSPSGITVKNTSGAAFFRRYLLEEAMSVFKWELPEGWSKNYFLRSLYVGGVVAVINTDRYGVIPQFGTISGFNVFYQPYRVTISNPLLKGLKSPIIGKECSLFRMNSDYGSIMDVVNFYADYLALLAQTAGVNIINSKTTWQFYAKNKAMAESIKKATDKAENGDPFVVVDKGLADSVGNGSLAVPFADVNVRQNFITPDLLECMRTVKNMFCTTVGIPNANINKKERLIADEVNANNEETAGLASFWLESWQESAEQTVELFGEDCRVKVDWRQKKVEDFENESDTERSGVVQLR